MGNTDELHSKLSCKIYSQNLAKKGEKKISLCMAHLRWHSCWKPSGWNGGDGKIHCPTRVEWAHQAPGRLSCSDLGKAQNAGPTDSVSLWSTQESENEWLRPGNYTQLMAHFRKLPCRATWNLSSVDQGSTHAMSRGKPSVTETLQALPTRTSDLCLPCSSLPTARPNKWA